HSDLSPLSEHRCPRAGNVRRIQKFPGQSCQPRKPPRPFSAHAVGPRVGSLQSWPWEMVCKSWFLLEGFNADGSQQYLVDPVVIDVQTGGAAREHRMR